MVPLVIILKILVPLIFMEAAQLKLMLGGGGALHNQC